MAVFRIVFRCAILFYTTYKNPSCREDEFMKKIIIDETIAASIGKGSSILQRKDMKLFTVKTNEEVMSIHRAERVNLIISRVDLPGK